MLIAHRGFGENHMQDFEKALQVCSGVELDIRLTKDHKIIICHDENLFRLGNTDQEVRNLTYQEIIQLPHFQKHPEELPPLFIDDFATKLARFYELINVEIKADHQSLADYKVIEAGLKTLRKLTTAKIIISSFNLQTLRRTRKLNHIAFQTAYLLWSINDLDKNLLKHVDYLNPSLKSVLKKQNVMRYQKLKKPLNIWTFNEQAEVDQVKELYPENLIYGYISNRFLKI